MSRKRAKRGKSRKPRQHRGPQPSTSKSISWDHVRDVIREVSEERGIYSGEPLPIQNFKLVTADPESRLNGSDLGTTDDAQPPRLNDFAFVCKHTDIVDIVNSWWSRSRQSYVRVVAREDGSRAAAYTKWGATFQWMERYRLLFGSLDAAQQAWSWQAEMKAMETLFGLITPAQAEMYMMQGHFIERSKRSQCAYVFRRMRPTIVLQNNAAGGYSPGVTLCLHPVAYYAGTFAGGMVPTDDVIAHLMLMRGDEYGFWKRANQHPPDRPESGI